MKRKPHPVGVQLGRDPVDVLDQELDQLAHLLLGASPVLGREGKDAELADPELGRVPQPVPNVLGAGAVPGAHPRPRAFAQRPLPSVMIATCRGPRSSATATQPKRADDRPHPGAGRFEKALANPARYPSRSPAAFR